MSTDPSPPAVQIQPQRDSELEQLLARYEQQKPKAEKAARELKETTDRIKVLLAQWSSSGQDVTVSSPVLTGGPLQYHPKPRAKWDHSGLRKFYPEIAREFSQVDQVWYLERL